MVVALRRQLMTAAGAVAAVALGGVALAPAALAATPAQPYGTVVSPTGLHERQLPTVDSASVGTLAYKAQVGLACKVHGQNIDGNDLWYKLRNQVNGKDAWVAARYVANTGTVTVCASSPQLSSIQSEQTHQHARSGGLPG